MPVYNGEKYVAEAIHSILKQSFENFELLVIDDGSRDSSADIVSQIRDDRIRLIKNEKNLGVAKSLNKLILESQGEFVARMDADDIALPNRFEKQLNYIEENSDISICGSWVKCFGEEDHIFRYPEHHRENRLQLLLAPCFAHPAVMWRKSDFIKNDLKYQEDPPTAEDYDLWVKASKKLKLANVQEVLLEYRMDPQIKVSSYILQQREGNFRLKKELLTELLGCSASDEKVRLWSYMVGSMDQLESASSSELALELICLMSAMNSKSGIYDQKSLNDVLIRAFYSYLSKQHLFPIRQWIGMKLTGEFKKPIEYLLKLFVKFFLLKIKLKRFD